MRQLEVDTDLGINFDGLAIKKIRLVLPSLDGIHGRSAQLALAAHHFYPGNVAVFGNRGQQLNCPLDPHGHSGWRIDRVHSLDQQAS